MAGQEPPERVKREQEFYNAGKSSYDRTRRWISRAIGAFNRSQEVHSFYDPAGKVVLDYGCGEGRFAFTLLERGATHVTGMDISERRVAEAARQAAARGLGGQTRFLVADAHATEFAEGSFDLVVGSDILHHLDLPLAVTELRRIVKPGGAAVFVEPLAHNPLARLGRRLTPRGRTPDEYPLTVDAWVLCAEVFEDFEHHEREFITIPFMPVNLILPLRAQQALARLLGRLDDWLLERFPRLRPHARRTILILR